MAVTRKVLDRVKEVSVYLRQTGATVPSIYGPSADES
jgi:hypothetical protein